MARRYLIIGPEATYGTRATVTRRFDISGEGLSDRRTRELLFEARAGAATEQWESSRGSSGSLDLLPGYNNLTRLWYHTSRHQTATNPTGSVWVHTFRHDPRREPPTSLSFGVDRDLDIAWRLGGVVNGMRWATQRSGEVPFEVSVEAQAEVSDDKEAGLVYSDFPDVPIIIGNSRDVQAQTLTIDGDAADSIGNLELEVRWARKLFRESRSLDPVGIRDEGLCQAEGTLRWFYTPDTRDRLLAYYAMGTVALVASWTGPAISGGYSYKFQISLPNCRFLGTAPNIKGSGGKLALQTRFQALQAESLNLSPYEITTTGTLATPASWS